MKEYKDSGNLTFGDFTRLITMDFTIRNRFFLEVVSNTWENLGYIKNIFHGPASEL